MAPTESAGFCTVEAAFTSRVVLDAGSFDSNEFEFSVMSEMSQDTSSWVLKRLHLKNDQLVQFMHKNVTSQSLLTCVRCDAALLHKSLRSKL